MLGAELGELELEGVDDAWSDGNKEFVGTELGDELGGLELEGIDEG